MAAAAAHCRDFGGTPPAERRSVEPEAPLRPLTGHRRRRWMRARVAVTSTGLGPSRSERQFVRLFGWMLFLFGVLTKRMTEKLIQQELFGRTVSARCLPFADSVHMMIGLLCWRRAGTGKLFGRFDELSVTGVVP